MNHLAQLVHGLRLPNIGTWIEGEAQLDIFGKFFSRKYGVGASLEVLMGFDDTVGVETSAFALRKAWLLVGNSCKRCTFLKIEHGTQK